MMFYYYIFHQEQLECAARRKKNFSKAAKHLMHLMFTDEERSGRRVTAFKKKFGGTTVSKEGLADQEKLAVLQGKVTTRVALTNLVMCWVTVNLKRTKAIVCWNIDLAA